MSWLEVRMNGSAEAVDWVRTTVATLACSAELQVETGSDFGSDAGSDAGSDWTHQIRLYLPANTTSMQINQLMQQLSPLERTGLISSPEITPIATPPSLKPSLHRVGQRLLILPPQTDYQPTAAEVAIRLEASLAFGSGLHPATFLSLRLLERQIKPQMATLDLGSGSGILAVAMAKLGAQVLALDNDPIAVQATGAAVALNQVGSQVEVRSGSLGAGSHFGHWLGGDLPQPVEAIVSPQFDLIAANILARLHLALVNDYQQALRPGGLLITAGYTSDYEPELNRAFAAAGLEPIDIEREQDWVAIGYRLQDRSA